jgi:hypothetical protein
MKTRVIQDDPDDARRVGVESAGSREPDPPLLSDEPARRDGAAQRDHRRRPTAGAGAGAAEP